MKKILNFDVDGIDHLGDLLRTGLKGYATDTAQLGGMATFWCFLCNEEVLKIYSIMTDISDWDEVGTLTFRSAAEDRNVPKMIPLPSSWNCITSVEKLVLNEIDFSAASGLVIHNYDGEKITLVCGANVYSIQVKAPFFIGKFSPEYEISKYERYPL